MLSEKSIRPHMLVLLIAAFLMPGCGGGGGAIAEQTISSAVALTISPHADNTLMALASVVSQQPGRASIEFSATNVDAHSTKYTDTATNHVITVAGMRANTTYTMTAVIELDGGGTAESAPVAFTTGSLPINTPTVTLNVSEAGSLGGITFFGSGVGVRTDPTAPLYFGVDEDGEIVWYLHGTNLSRGNPAIRHMGNGILLAFIEDGAIEVNNAGMIVAQHALGSINYHHEIRVLPNGNTLSLTTERVGTPGTASDITADVITELDSLGNTVWEWSTADYLDTSRFPGALSTEILPNGSQDWSHANGLYYSETDDTIMISLRSQSWIVKIDHSTKDILWIFGDSAGTANGFTTNFFNLQSGSFNNSQHAPTITGQGELLIYDNRNESGGPVENSRGVIFSIDESNFVADQTWQFISPKYTRSLGDVDELANDNILVTSGGPSPTTADAYISEVTRDVSAITVWEIIVSGDVYRAERVSWDEFL